MPVDPCFAPMLESIASMPPPPPGSDPVAAARAGTDAMFVHPAPPELDVQDRTIPGPGGELPIRVYTPRGDGPGADARGVLVYFHGGGFVAGSVASHDGTVRELAAGADCIAVSVEYRLAPEHLYPAAFDDCRAALAWVLEHAAELGGDPQRVAVGGDSAGGNLCAAVVLHHRDQQGAALALQLLVYPVIDPACATASMDDNATGYLLTADSMRWMWQTYAGGDVDPDDPYLCPVAARDLSGLPPTVVITAEFDPLRDEGEQYAGRLLEAGVPTMLRRYDGQLHGFFSMYAMAPQARVATDEAVRALRAAFER